jgi:hypothetical protein
VGRDRWGRFVQSEQRVRGVGTINGSRLSGCAVSSDVCLGWGQGGRWVVICSCVHGQGPTLSGWGAQHAVRQRGTGVISESVAQGHCDAEKVV